MTEVDMQKLAVAFFDNLERSNVEYGGIGLDDKRPFGNSLVECDILEIIGAEPIGVDGTWSDEQLEYAAQGYDELIEWLQSKYGSNQCQKPSMHRSCAGCHGAGTISFRRRG